MINGAHEQSWAFLLGDVDAVFIVAGAGHSLGGLVETIGATVSPSGLSQHGPKEEPYGISS